MSALPTKTLPLLPAVRLNFGCPLRLWRSQLATPRPPLVLFPIRPMRRTKNYLARLLIMVRNPALAPGQRASVYGEPLGDSQVRVCADQGTWEEAHFVSELVWSWPETRPAPLCVEGIGRETARIQDHLIRGRPPTASELRRTLITSFSDAKLTSCAADGDYLPAYTDRARFYRP